MKKFEGYLICTDCDGTLTDKDGRLSEKNSQAIKYFQENGGLFTLATGRFPEHIELFKDSLKINAPIVSLNGTLLYDIYKKEIINQWTMNKDECFEVVEYVQNNWPQVWEYWINYSYCNSAGYKPMENKPGDGTLKQLFDSLPMEISKIVIIQPEDITPLIQKDLKERFGHKFRFDTSWQNGLEIQDINSGKGVAVKYMKEHLGVHIHTTVGIGDYENDISLLECSDIGYAVENAIDSVKAIATKITVSNNDDAIACVIMDLEEHIKIINIGDNR